MFIEVFKNNGIEYLRLAESRRKTNQHGVKVSSKKIILNIAHYNVTPSLKIAISENPFSSFFVFSPFATPIT